MPEVIVGNLLSDSECDGNLTLKFCNQENGEPFPYQSEKKCHKKYKYILYP